MGDCDERFEECCCEGGCCEWLLPAAVRDVQDRSIVIAATVCMAGYVTYTVAVFLPGLMTPVHPRVEPWQAEDALLHGGAALFVTVSQLWNMWQQTLTAPDYVPCEGEASGAAGGQTAGPLTPAGSPAPVCAGGSIRQRNGGDAAALAEGDPPPPAGEPHEWCGKCSCWRPPAAHHCRKCRRCVYGFDHHCTWTDNCVATRTLRPFLLFVGYSAVACTHYLYLLFLYFRADRGHPLASGALGQVVDFAMRAGAGALAFIVCWMLMFATWMFWSTTWRVVTGVNMIGEPAEWAAADASCQWLRNLRAVLGAFPPLWFLPAPPPPLHRCRSP
eukprot:TRINITY_DN25635_c0_g1_i1.p1 TRINITY_DN25635_c0_g1~~TRINITY_DN25635_c0_g1_i1.p1  ORF type:complete len:356 (+),score=54.45 TRINITY_DN25635_c0_g1_i1:79-1068(+)